MAQIRVKNTHQLALLVSDQIENKELADTMTTELDWLEYVAEWKS